MIESVSVNHYIQKHILDVLMFTELARFRDLRPPRTDTNLFSYHLQVLIKQGLVTKTEHGYTLSTTGLEYVDRVSVEKRSIRTQPKIVTMLVLQNSGGDVLLQKRTKQPYINTWTLPYGKVHTEDETVYGAARREAREKIGLELTNLVHAGDCYIRVTTTQGLLSTTLCHVFRGTTDLVTENPNLHWARPHKLHTYTLAPAVTEIMTRTFFKDPFFFEEFTVDWYSKGHASTRLPTTSSNHRKP